MNRTKTMTSQSATTVYTEWVLTYTLKKNS